MSIRWLSSLRPFLVVRGFFLGDAVKEKTQLQIFLVFLFIVFSMALAQASFAAVVLTPTVAGYSASAGRFAATAGSFTMAAANEGYIAQSVVNVAGKAVTMPATLRMAANVGVFAVSAMRLNPYLIVGTAAAAWLLSQGIEQQNGQYVKSAGYLLHPGDQASGGYPYYIYGSVASLSGNGATTPYENSCVSLGGYFGTIGSDYGCVFYGAVPSPSYVPATQSDFDVLPSLPDAVKQELPFAPYLPQGVPVDKPEFAPADVPLGNPYTKPDGSTAQPRAKISPSGDGQVTVAPYDQPLTDPTGNPLPNAAPEPTADPPQDQCQLHPDTVGCATLGSDSFSLTPETRSVTFSPESSPISGACPASITVGGNSISFLSACDAMGMIRPLVIALAGVMAAFMIVTAMRT